MFCETWFGNTHYKGDGRVMIDAVSFAKMNPSYEMETARNVEKVDRHKNNYDKSIKEEELFMCAPSLYGFSFTTKKWGQLYIDNLNGRN